VGASSVKEEEARVRLVRIYTSIWKMRKLITMVWTRKKTA
jgi:hypothetical protein